MNRILVLSTLLAVVAGSHISALAQSKSETVSPPEPIPAKTLKVGDLCPPLSVEKFLKGDSIKEFELGNVYVVEFWAKWCGPCIQAIPHLSTLQTQYKDQKVDIIGVNIRELRRSGPGWEEAFDEEARTEVEEFVRRQGDQMSYTVAYDGAKKLMDKAWMPKDAGLPRTFIVDREGRIAWIGHPMILRMPLDEVVNGTWDVETGPDRVKKAEDAYLTALRLIEASGEEGLKAWEQAERDHPILALDLVGMKFDALISANLCDAAFESGKTHLQESVKRKDIRALNRLAWSIVDPSSNLDARDLDLAMKAAHTAKILSNSDDPEVLDTLARVYFRKRQVDDAIELQTRAIEIADEQMKLQLQTTLNEYLNYKKRK